MAKKPTDDDPNPETENTETPADVDETDPSAKLTMDESYTVQADDAPAQTFKPRRMSKDDAAILEGLKGDFAYSGAPLHFNCRKGESHFLIPGKTYPASKLPKHELIASAIARKVLVPVETETKEA